MTSRERAGHSVRSLVLLLVVSIAGCRPQAGGDPVPLPPIEQVVDRHAPALMQIPGVTMVYVGVDEDEEPCIHVGFTSLPHEGEARVPDELEGWPVLVEETGEVRPLGSQG